MKTYEPTTHQKNTKTVPAEAGQKTSFEDFAKIRQHRKVYHLMSCAGILVSVVVLACFIAARLSSRHLRMAEMRLPKKCLRKHVQSDALCMAVVNASTETGMQSTWNGDGAGTISLSGVCRYIRVASRPGPKAEAHRTETRASERGELRCLPITPVRQHTVLPATILTGLATSWQE